MPEIVQEAGVQETQLSWYCRRCHRKLRSEKAMHAGFGKVCALKFL
jgi:hypothetical protein